MKRILVGFATISVAVVGLLSGPSAQAAVPSNWSPTFQALEEVSPCLLPGETAPIYWKYSNPANSPFEGPSTFKIYVDGQLDATVVVDPGTSGNFISKQAYPGGEKRYELRLDYTGENGETQSLNGSTAFLLQNNCDQEYRPPIIYGPTTPAPTFTDTAGNRFASEISWLAGRNITTGYANGNGTNSFRPSGAVLREQMAAFLYRYKHEGTNPDRLPGASRFKDVAANHVFKAHIAWLAMSGVTTGYDDGTFRPGQPVLREQMAAFLYRLAGKPSFTAPRVSPFADIPTSHTFYKEITWLASTKVTTGYVEGRVTTFRGSQPVLREQMAAFLFRFDAWENTQVR